MNIYLSPSRQTANIGAYVNTNEHEQCQRIAEYARNYLTGNFDCNVLIAKQADKAEQRAPEAMQWGAEFYLAIHTNAFNDITVEGVETYFNDSDSVGKEFAGKLLQDLVDIGIKKRRTKVQNLLELNLPTCPRAYVEIDFHSNPERAKWIVENAQLIGETIARCIIDFFVIPEKNTYKYALTATSPALPVEQAEKERAELVAKGYTVTVESVTEFQEKPDEKPEQETGKLLKSIDEIALEVIRGAWGNGNDRKTRLTEAGYNPTEVQKRVNEILMGR